VLLVVLINGVAWKSLTVGSHGCEGNRHADVESPFIRHRISGLKRPGLTVRLAI